MPGTRSTPKVHPIRAARQRRGWSQSALGAKVATTKATVSKWERGEAMPEPAMAFKLAAALRIRLEDVYATARAA